jgi:PAS domain S-box-containing protein
MDNGQCILVVDDELGPREALRMILKSRYEVMTASSGPEALRLLRQTPPDLVFLDIKMREMSGVEVLKAIKQVDATIEVIMMTAYASLETAREAVAHNASDYLIKPFSKAEVDRAVAKALARRAERTGPRQEVRTLLEQMRALAEASAHGTGSQDFVQSATVILEQGKHVLRATAALLYSLEAPGQSLACQVVLNIPNHLHDTCASGVWHSLLKEVLVQRQPLRFPGGPADMRHQELAQALHRLGCAAGTFFPVLAGNEALGVLSFLYHAAHEVRADWQELGQSCADLMALAIQAQQRYQASQQEATQQAQRVAQLSILREMIRVIMDTLDLNDMLCAMGKQLQGGLGYAGCSVWLRTPETPHLRQVYGTGVQSGWQPQAEGDNGLSTLRVERMNDAQVVIAPIVLAGETIGAVELVRDRQCGPIAAFEIELIRMVLDYLGMAVKNSQLYGEIKETKSYLENLINGAGDAIVTVNTTGTITSWNVSAERIFGYRQEDILHQNVCTLFPPQPYAQWRREVLQEGLVKRLEARFCQRNGTPVDVSLTLSPLHGPRDEIVGLSAIMKDITEEKHLREQLLRSEKLRALGEIAAGVAHNFNNILTTILGHTQLLLEDAEDGHALQAGLRTIEQASKDAAQMVRRIQTFAKGNTAAECLPTDLNLVVKEAAEATRPVWKEQAERQGKCIQLELELHPVPLVPCREAELREVLTNLILNAVDAMPTGGTITLQTHQQGQWGCVAVSDTGTGMSEDVQRRIFDPFFTTKKSKGTGLGLSVSYTLVRGHGGDIEVQSTLGRGTTFVVKLPMVACGTQPAACDI